MRWSKGSYSRHRSGSLSSRMKAVSSYASGSLKLIPRPIWYNTPSMREISVVFRRFELRFIPHPSESSRITHIHCYYFFTDHTPAYVSPRRLDTSLLSGASHQSPALVPTAAEVDTVAKGGHGRSSCETLGY